MAFSDTCRIPSDSGSVAFPRRSAPGGKALLATLMAALVSKRKIDVQTKACDIVEVYLK